ncbi:hypothetical protein ABZ820_12400 [Streptomyces diacarni]|uniref:hypothetical protein n=1 Tax=Streptomyces diacarni TaxID=2800381 RepID=UPI00340E1C7C
MRSAVEEKTIYYRFPNGSVAERTVTGGADEVTPPEGAVEISEEEYRAALAAIEEANEQRRQEQEAEAEAQRKADYEALRALGLPEETARRITGYTGPDESEES